MTYTCDECIFWNNGFCDKWKKETKDDDHCDSWEDEDGSSLGEDW